MSAEEQTPVCGAVKPGTYATGHDVPRCELPPHDGLHHMGVAGHYSVTWPQEEPASDYPCRAFPHPSAPD